MEAKFAVILLKAIGDDLSMTQVRLHMICH